MSCSCTPASTACPNAGGSTTGGRPGAASSASRAPNAASRRCCHAVSEAAFPADAGRGAPGAMLATYSSAAAPANSLQGGFGSAMKPRLTPGGQADLAAGWAAAV